MQLIIEYISNFKNYKAMEKIVKTTIIANITKKECRIIFAHIFLFAIAAIYYLKLSIIMIEAVVDIG